MRRSKIWSIFLLLLWGCGVGQDPVRVVLTENQIMVQPGDTLSGLAHRYRVKTKALALLNQLRPPYRLYAGQVLIVPPKVSKISRSKGVKRHPVAVAPIAEESQKIWPQAVSVASASTLLPQEAAALKKNTQRETGKSPSAAPKPKEAIDASEGPLFFIWPLKGELVQKFSSNRGHERSDGIRIRATLGAKVCAAEKGRVIYIGRDVPEMGNLVLLRHRSGWVSAYGHIAHTVQSNQIVKKGQMLGRVEKNSDITQIYFEMRREGAKPVDPLLHLKDADEPIDR